MSGFRVIPQKNLAVVVQAGMRYTAWKSCWQQLIAMAVWISVGKLPVTNVTGNLPVFYRYFTGKIPVKYR